MNSHSIFNSRGNEIDKIKKTSVAYNYFIVDRLSSNKRNNVRRTAQDR